jgi:hypothetical protein
VGPAALTYPAFSLLIRPTLTLTALLRTYAAAFNPNPSAAFAAGEAGAPGRCLPSLGRRPSRPYRRRGELGNAPVPQR